MPVATPTDRQFRRSYVRPTRRRSRFWSARWLAILSVMAASLVGGGYYVASVLASADVLTVSRITVSGNRKLSRGEVLALLQPLEGQNMLFLDLDGVRRSLMASPWVADAALRRELPGRLDVVIVERQPMAIGRFAEGLFLVDRQGGIVDEFGPHHADLDLPLVDGLGDESVAGGPAADPARAALAARLLGALQEHPDLAARVSQVDVADSRDAVVMLDGDTALVHVGEDHFVERLRTYVDVAGTLRERVPQIDSVDVRHGDRVYVRPRASSAPGNEVAHVLAADVVER